MRKKVILLLVVLVQIMALLIAGCSTERPSSEPASLLPTPAGNTSLDNPQQSPGVVTDIPSPTASDHPFYSGTPLAPAPSAIREYKTPFLLAYDYDSHELNLFPSDSLIPFAVSVPRPYENFFHPSPSFDRIAYISENFGEDSGLELTILETESGELVSNIPLTEPGWEVSTRTGEMPDKDPIPAITDPDGVSWSNDGRYLAFTGAIDRFDADLYVLDTQTQEVFRVAATEHSPNAPTWTSDGERLAYLHVRSFGTGAGWTMEGIWMVDLSTHEDRRVLELDGESLLLERWIGADTLLVSRGHNVMGDHDLGILHVDTGEILWFFEGPLHAAVSIDDETNFFIQTVQTDENTLLETYGLFYISPESPPAPVLLLNDQPIYALGWSEAQGVVYLGLADETVLFSSEGEWIATIQLGGEVSISPDGEWLVSFNPNEGGMTIFSFLSLEHQVFQELMLETVIWDPQSSGMVLVTQTHEIYTTLLTEEEAGGWFSRPQQQLSNAYLSNNFQP